MFSATVFYAWQSDRPGKTNRHLIREAAEAACLRITEDDSFPWSLTLDSDTRGKVGMCDIPNTILEKIEECDIFLADLTLVAVVNADDEAGKQMPNANVIFELGFAAGKLSFEPIVGVMNEAFGDIDGQVFDVKRRSSLTYNVSAEASSIERRKAKDVLSKRLEEVFRKTLSKVVHERRKESGRQAEEVFSSLREQCASRILSGEFHDVKDLPVVMVSVRPREPHPVDVDSVLGQLRMVIQNPRVMGDTISWSEYATTVEFDAENSILFHVFSGDYLSVQNYIGRTMHSRLNESEDVPPLLHGHGLQRNVVKHVSESCRILNSIGVSPPWDVGISLLGGKGFKLIVNDNESSRESLKEPNIHLPSAVVPTQDAVADEATTGAFLRKTLNRLVRQFGEEHNPCFDAEGNWRVQE